MSQAVSPPESPPPPGRLISQFLPTFFANTLTMAGMGLVVFWLVDHDNRVENARERAMSQQIDVLRAEQDRVASLNQELAREIHDLDAESEILHWQLRYTEERLRQATDTASQPRRVARTTPHPRVQPLDDESARWLEERVETIAAGRTAVGETAVGETAVEEAAAPEARVTLGDDPQRDLPEVELGSRLALADFSPGIPSLRSVTSQFSRDRAKVKWDTVVDDAVVGECGRDGRDGRSYKCGDNVRRRLFPFSTAAVNCIVSGNATPDYVETVVLDNLPSHSVPLERGGVILCDGALQNF